MIRHIEWITVLPGVRRSMVLLVLLTLAGCTTAPLSGNNARDASQVNAELGAKYLQRGELDLARDKLEKAIAQNKKNALAQATYGSLLQQTGERGKAEKYFQRAIALEPDNAEYHNKYGVFLCQEGNVKLAVQQFDIAAEDAYYRTPEYALDNAGICLMDNGDLAGAEKYLRAAVRKNPKFAGSYLHFAQLVHKQKRLATARAYLINFRSRNGKETPESLLLAVNIYRDLNDSATAKKFADRLLSEFPSSREAGEYLARPLN